MNPQLSPVNIDDRISSRRSLEGWMLFPGDDEESELLRWSYIKNSCLDDLERDLQIYTPADTVTLAKEEILTETESNYIELKPRQYSGPQLVLINQIDLAKVLERPTALCLKLARKHSVDGFVAGSILIYMRILEQNKISPPSSFDKAKLISEKRDFPNRKTQNYSESSIEPRNRYPDGVLDKTWQKYSSVAHLWAALLALNGFNFKPAASPLHGISNPSLVSIAFNYAKWGVDFFSNEMNRKSRRKDAFNPVDVTYSGSLQPQNFDFANLPTDDLAMELIRKVYPA